MEVNFVFQVRSFHRFKREVKLSANAQALWLELFGLFNERRFPDTMPVSTTHLSTMLGISKDGVIRARRELIENQLLEEAGERRGRQHTTYRIKYFTVTPVHPAAEPDAAPVDNPVENLLTEERRAENTPVCDAGDDAFCDANEDANFATQETTQSATQNLCDASDDANCDTKSGCDANCVDICGTYINNKPIFKPKRRVIRKGKRSPYGDIKKPSSSGATAERACVAREGKLCYNTAWKTDARARAATAQNVIDALGNRRLEDGLNGTICKYLQMGLTPQQALETLRSAGDASANEALNEAAYRLGVYHAASDAGAIDVEPDALYTHGGDLKAARAWAQYERRRAAREKAFSLMPGYREYLNNKARIETYRAVCEQIDRHIDLGRNMIEILHEIRRTEEYRAYENEQKLAEQ